MHRRAGVKMHYGRSQVNATPNAAFQFDQWACFFAPAVTQSSRGTWLFQANPNQGANS
jgi:hypothetical protein